MTLRPGVHFSKPPKLFGPTYFKNEDLSRHEILQQICPLYLEISVKDQLLRISRFQAQKVFGTFEKWALGVNL